MQRIDQADLRDTTDGRSAGSEPGMWLKVVGSWTDRDQVTDSLTIFNKTYNYDSSYKQSDGVRYSARDVALLREVQRLSQDEGVNLAGIKRIIELESHVDALQQRVAELAAELDHAHAELIARRGPSTALVVWRPQRR